MNAVFLEDCRDTVGRLSYHYVLMSPPDFHELNMPPKNVDAYIDFLDSIFRLLDPLRNAMTVVISDRKYKGTIISKHSEVCSLLFDLGWKLHSHKIWVKSLGSNPYRLNYAHILSFTRGGARFPLGKEYRPDVWMDRENNYRGFRNCMPVELAIRCIRNFSKPDDVVFDPFMGSGTTAVAAIRTGRRYFGSEIDAENFAICEGRLVEESVSKPTDDEQVSPLA